MTGRTKLLTVGLVAAALVLPFANKAYHIDDYTMISAARHLSEHPFAHDGPLFVRGGEVLESLICENTHPPFVPYYLALVMRVAGSESEAVLHTASLVFMLLLGAAVFSLARQFGAPGLLSALLALSCPGVIVMSHSLAADLPLAALSAAALALFIRGVDRERPAEVALSGVAFLFAFFCAYQAVFLVPLALLYSLSRRKGIRPVVLAVAWPLLLFAGWMAAVHLLYDSSPLRVIVFPYLGMEHLYRGPYMLERLVSLIVNIGANPALVIVAVALLIRGKKWPLAASSAAAAAVLAAWYPERPGGGNAVLFFLFALGGAAVVAVFLDEAAGWMRGLHADSRRCEGSPAARDRAAPQVPGSSTWAGAGFMLAWFAGLAAATVVFMNWGAVRHTLVMLPPLVIVLARRVGREIRPAPRARRLCAAAVACSLAVGLLVAAADYEYAGRYRSFARSLGEAREPGREVWFVAEWGLRYYMEEEGFRYLPGSPGSLQEGDLVVLPTEAWTHPLFGEFRRRSHLRERWTLEARIPLRTSSKADGIGFYSHRLGILPYGLSRRPLERMEMAEPDAETVRWWRTQDPNDKSIEELKAMRR